MFLLGRVAADLPPGSAPLTPIGLGVKRITSPGTPGSDWRLRYDPGSAMGTVGDGNGLKPRAASGLDLDLTGYIEAQRRRRALVASSLGQAEEPGPDRALRPGPFPMLVTWTGTKALVQQIKKIDDPRTAGKKATADDLDHFNVDVGHRPEVPRAEWISRGGALPRPCAPRLSGRRQP